MKHAEGVEEIVYAQYLCQNVINKSIKKYLSNKLSVLNKYFFIRFLKTFWN